MVVVAIIVCIIGLLLRREWSRRKPGSLLDRAAWRWYDVSRLWARKPTAEEAKANMRDLMEG